MQELWKLVRSPRHLMVFEAAARLGSFTRAADEMNVQQPAVSAAIQQLEASLGAALFARAHRKVELTAAGARLYADVSRALGAVHISASKISGAAGRAHVTLNASSAFVYYWMMPRLRDLHLLHPDIDLRLQSSDREPDIAAEGIDLAIRRGSGKWPGCKSAPVAQEVIFPIASPRVMAAAKNLRSVPNLLQERLIHLEEPIRERPTWGQWFAHHGLPGREPERGLRLNDYALVLQAAIAGEGFAFGWRHVTAGLIEKGLLAARPEWAWKTGQSFHLVWSAAAPLSPQARIVRDWILKQVQAHTRQIDTG